MLHYRPFLLVALLIAALHLCGWLEPLERDLMDLRAGLQARPASGELVVVAIDAPSLQALNRWPWPRRHHAKVLANLIAAGAAPGRVRHRFQLALERVRRSRAGRGSRRAPGRSGSALAVHRQWVRDQVFDTAPLAQFLRHASSASINVEPDPEGLVRQVATGAAWRDGRVPTMPAWLLGTAGQAGRNILVDFSIDPATIPILSFVDVLSGRFDPALVAGKIVLGRRDRDRARRLAERAPSSRAGGPAAAGAGVRDPAPGSRPAARRRRDDHRRQHAADPADRQLVPAPALAPRVC